MGENDGKTAPYEQLSGDTAARVTSFARNFDVEALLSASPQWFNDLLGLWRPSGVEAGSTGLRLAVRDGYLNFYRLGQSVARVHLDRRRRPYADIHFKYVFPERKSHPGSPYVRLSGDRIRGSNEEVLEYGGTPMLISWIERAEAHSGREKKAIDAVLSFGGSAGVIDLEMGQPGTALRMDIVALERDGSDLFIAFWEAKRARDARVRCSGPLDHVGKFPRVLSQLKDYGDFASAPGNAQRIASAYKRTAEILVRLRRYADEAGHAQPLGADIKAAAHKKLSVREAARLLIINDDPSDHAWRREHQPKLEAAGLQMAVQEQPAALQFGTAG